MKIVYKFLSYYSKTYRYADGLILSHNLPSSEKVMSKCVLPSARRHHVQSPFHFDSSEKLRANLWCVQTGWYLPPQRVGTGLRCVPGRIQTPTTTKQQQQQLDDN